MLPLTGAAINGFFGKKFSRPAVAGNRAGASAALRSPMALMVAVARFSSLCIFLITSTWRSGSESGGFQVDFAFYLDQLSLVMLLVVTGVGFLIHIYSVGYMWETPASTASSPT